MIKNAPAGWEDAPEPTVPRRGIFIDIVGTEGSGKSSLAMTLPGPVAYVDIDQSSDRAKRPNGAKVRRILVPYDVGPPGTSKESVKSTCHDAWERVEKMVGDAVKDWARSVVLDTGTEGWELKRLASFGELNPKGRRMDRLYGPVNAQYRQFLRNIYRIRARHLATVHQLYDEWVDKMKDGEMMSVRTGRKTPKGFKEVGYLADIVVRCFREDGAFKACIEVCKLPPNGPSLEGTVVEEDMLSFASIIALATETEPEKWK